MIAAPRLELKAIGTTIRTLRPRPQSARCFYQYHESRFIVSAAISRWRSFVSCVTGPLWVRTGKAQTEQMFSGLLP